MSEFQKIIISSVIKDKSNLKSSDQIYGHSKKLSFVDFEVDKPKIVPFRNSTSASKIKIREDILSDLTSIKEQLNIYGIPLSCDIYTPDIDNKNLSDFERVGLEIRLYPSFTMNQYSSYDNDDYFVGPHNKYPNILNVYGNVRKDDPFTESIYAPKKDVYSIFNIKETLSKSPPATQKIYKKLFNITKLFNDYGFVQPKPKLSFFNKSIVEDSNWNIFQKVSNIKIGMSYKELLEKTYVHSKSIIWLEKDRYWDGEKFNGR